MKKAAMLLAVLVAAGCSSRVPLAGDGANQGECATNRSVREVVVRLRDKGWTADRTVGTVLSSAHVADAEARDWFVALVADIYGNHTTLAQVDADYVACMRQSPANGAVLSAGLR